MGNVQRGFYWHVHHGKLIEFCYGYEERASFIRTDKPAHEQETRFHLFKPVKGSLPQAVVEAWQVYNKAWQVYDEASQARDKAGQVCDKARQVYDKAWQAYDKAGQAYDIASQAYDKAWQARDIASQARYKAWQVCEKAWRAWDKALNNNMPAIIALHEKECPNCPWNGETIFPKT